MKHKHMLLTVILFIGTLAFSGISIANEGHCKWGEGSCGQGGHMSWLCPAMSGPHTKVKVEEVNNGINIKVTSTEKKEIERIKTKGKILQLIHDLHHMDQ